MPTSHGRARPVSIVRVHCLSFTCMRTCCAQVTAIHVYDSRPYNWHMACARCICLLTLCLRPCSCCRTDTGWRGWVRGCCLQQRCCVRHHRLKLTAHGVCVCVCMRLWLCRPCHKAQSHARGPGGRGARRNMPKASNMDNTRKNPGDPPSGLFI